MHRLLDVLASGVHDTKNQLFYAESQIAEAEAKHGLDLSEARYAIETAAVRLTRTLTAYHLLRNDATLAVVPVVVVPPVSPKSLSSRPRSAPHPARAARRPCRRGDRCGQVQGGADHPGRPAARRGHGDRHRAAQPRRHADTRRAFRVPLRADRREHVCDVRHAPHA